MNMNRVHVGGWVAMGLATGLILTGCSMLSWQDTSRIAYRTGDASVLRAEGMPDGPPVGDYRLVDGSYGDEPAARDSTAGAVYESADGWMVYLERFTGDGHSGDVLVTSPQSPLEGGWSAAGSIGRECVVDISDDLATEFSGTVRCTGMPVKIRSGEDAEITIEVVFGATS